MVPEQYHVVSQRGGFEATVLRVAACVCRQAQRAPSHSPAALSISTAKDQGLPVTTSHFALS